MRTLSVSFAAAVSLLMVAGIAEGQKKSSSDAQYIAESLSAAPKTIAKNAAVVRIEKDGSMTTLRQGKNGFSCMITANNRMCADANSMEFFQAWAKHQNPPDKLGLTYMLGGDKGASNTDPFATKPTADNQWVVSGPHIMLLPTDTSQLDAYPTDWTKGGPWVMWKGTPYAHIMVPTTSMPKSASKAPAAKKTADTK